VKASDGWREITEEVDWQVVADKIEEMNQGKP